MILESGLVREEGDHYVQTGPLPPLVVLGRSIHTDGGMVS
jgi:hypothetical protein